MGMKLTKRAPRRPAPDDRQGRRTATTDPDAGGAVTPTHATSKPLPRGRTGALAAGALADLSSVATGPAVHTLVAAARLIGRPDSALRDDMRQSVRGGAALLASYERAAVGALPTDPGRWYAAVARYSQASDAAGARLFADRVYATIRSGASRITADGQQVTLTATASVA